MQTLFGALQYHNAKFFMICVFNFQVSPDALLNKCFRIRRFSRAELHKAYIRTQVQMKADGLLNKASRPVGRTKSHDNLPNPNTVNQITASSTNLTYKSVSLSFVAFTKSRRKKCQNNLQDNSKFPRFSSQETCLRKAWEFQIVQKIVN